jgi:hypothetical protein
MKPWTRAIALTTALTLAATSCGYILHPERRGQSGGTVDGGTLVMDLLWLLPGIVPGGVFLIVDFTSGAIYVNGRVAMRAGGNHELAVALRDSPTPRSLDLSVVTKSHEVLDHKPAVVGPAIHGQVVRLHVADTTEPVFLRIDDHQHPAIQLPIAIL